MTAVGIGEHTPPHSLGDVRIGEQVPSEFTPKATLRGCVIEGSKEGTVLSRLGGRCGEQVLTEKFAQRRQLDVHRIHDVDDGLLRTFVSHVPFLRLGAAHLHRPLLSAFLRSLSDLLTNRNGMAIIATHSPVVLQEVRPSCVWKLHRAGSNLTAERPNLETFGENVGTLTDEVFGLEVTATGFHKMLSDAAYESRDYEAALALLEGQLGAEGRAVLRALINTLAQADVER